MDLGIKNKKAIVCASSKGLGKACARSLMMEGVSVVINARGEESLKETFEELSLIDENKVSMTVADLNTEEGRKKLIESCPDADILINNNSGPPPINFLESNKEYYQRIEDDLNSLTKGRNILLSTEYTGEHMVVTYEADISNKRSPSQILSNFRENYSDLDVKILSGFDQFNV